MLFHCSLAQSILSAGTEIRQEALWIFYCDIQYEVQKQSLCTVHAVKCNVWLYQEYQ